jgi:hypothetical protein
MAHTWEVPFERAWQQHCCMRFCDWEDEAGTHG